MCGNGDIVVSSINCNNNSSNHQHQPPSDRIDCLPHKEPKKVRKESESHWASSNKKCTTCENKGMYNSRGWTIEHFCEECDDIAASHCQHSVPSASSSCFSQPSGQPAHKKLRGRSNFSQHAHSNNSIGSSSTSHIMNTDGLVSSKKQFWGDPVASSSCSNMRRVILRMMTKGRPARGCALKRAGRLTSFAFTATTPKEWMQHASQSGFLLTCLAYACFHNA